MLERLWLYNNGDGPSYYANSNKPIAAVIHIAVGWRSTAEYWAKTGHNGASWHYFNCLDGTLLHQLDHQHGGYHAGISSTRPDRTPNPVPTWPLWRGWNQNVNTYTIGIENEGFGPLTEAQLKTLKHLCQWLAHSNGWPYEQSRFPSHADIALIDRPNDFGTPFDRKAVYKYLFTPEEEDDMSPAVRGLLLVANGDFNNMTIAYNSLDKKGFFNYLNTIDNPAAPIDGVDDLNDAVTRRFRLQWLAYSDAAEAAWPVIDPSNV